MQLTFGRIREVVAPYAGRAGKCADSVETARFAWKVMNYLLTSGDAAAIRKICILAHKGCISMPPEVETPLKVRIDHRVGEVWNKWASYHGFNGDYKAFGRCYPAGEILIEDGAQTPLNYEIPDGGSIIGAFAHCEEADGAVLHVQGKDPVGNIIYTTFNGENISGEMFRLKKGQLRYGNIRWGSIDEVKKPVTNGYVSLFAIDKQRNRQQYLASYSPLEETPLYKKFRVNSRDCGPLAHVSMLARIRLRDNYHDNDVTIFDSELALELAAQRCQAETNNDVQVAQYKDSALGKLLNEQAGYKKQSGAPIDVFFTLSGGAIKNIV